MLRLLWIGGLVAGAVLGCKAKNPDFCCITAEECDRLGVDQPVACGASQVCIDSECVEPQCSVSADCAEPPYCVDRVCVDLCRDSASCDGIAGLPYCSPAGACVACLDEANCPADAPVCDVDTHTCRPCTMDSECESGVCLVQEGACAAEADTVFVSDAGTDAGTCTSAAPCRTIAFGLARITAQRRVLRIASLDYTAADGIVLDRDVYLDGNDSRLQRTTAGPVLTVTNLAVATIEGIRIIAPAQAAIEITDRADVTMRAIAIDDADDLAGNPGITTTDSTLRMIDVVTTDTSLRCVGAGFQSHLELDRVTMTIGAKAPILTVGTLNCPARIVRSRFDGVSLDIDHGSTQIENNLLLQRRGGGLPAIAINDALLDTVVQFNTLAGSGGDSVGLDFQLTCSGAGTAVITSTVFAASSARPLGTGCAARYSLFDDDVGTVPPGMGNLLAPHAMVFTSEVTGDYAPTAASGALGASEPGLTVTEDFHGVPRPQPAGTTADIGAFEAP